MTAYFDTSALTKRYDLNEPNALTVQNYFQNHRGILTSTLTSIEIISAFSRKVNTGAYSSADLTVALLAYDNHAQSDYFYLSPQTNVYTEARKLILTHGLRGYDAMQLATALTINIPRSQLEFHTADKNLGTAAKLAGLIVIHY